MEMHRLLLYVKNCKEPSLVFYTSFIPRVGESIFTEEGNVYKVIDVQHVVGIGNVKVKHGSTIKEVQKRKVENICLLCVKIDNPSSSNS